MFPQKHSFSYSYLFVGVPIGWRGSVGSFLSADLESVPDEGKPALRRPKSWFRVEAADHLNRGNDALGLRGKLDVYLKSQGQDYKDYAHAYLITAPRFLGYSFNPVSFWYLYDEQKLLKAMILEVNNTFDERRMYFLKGGSDEVSGTQSSAVNDDKRSAKKSITEGNRASTEAPASDDTTGSSKFTDTWPKDFHVSPFNSRKGSYTLTANDPFSLLKNNSGPVNNTITLSSSKSHAKLIARVFSTSKCIDPLTLSQWEGPKFLASWWWVGFLTFPRIVREAGKLFFKRKLHVWYRPEVLKDSIGRLETYDERIIESNFRSLLHSLVSNSTLTVPFRYTSAVSTNPTPELIIPKSIRFEKDTNLSTPQQQQPIDLKITTPLFYAHLARQTNIHDFLTSESHTQTDQTRTFHISHNPKDLLDLFLQQRINPQRQQQQQTRWSLLLTLRHFSHPTSPPSSLSLLDISVLNTQSPTEARKYRHTVTKLLLSDIFTFGMPAALDTVLSLVRTLLCYVCVFSVRSAFARRGSSSWKGVSGGAATSVEGWDLGVGVGLVATHLWWGLGEIL